MMSCVMLSFLDFFQTMVNSIEFIHSGSGCHESCSLKHKFHDTEKPMVSAACICVHNRIVEFLVVGYWKPCLFHLMGGSGFHRMSLI